ncbi:MAG: type II toxin-antitoxin system HipA family toxin, partial [Spirochaetaceae bacterium]
MKRLTVYLHDNPVGTLMQTDGGTLEFRYVDEWLSRRDAVPLSRSLPLSGETYRANKARPFFAGILPDEGPRGQIASVLGISERNDFALLERIGGECAGAVALLPEDVHAQTATESVIRELDEAELAVIVSELPSRPLLAGSAGVRLSLAGSQGKLPVLLRGTTVALPL